MCWCENTLTQNKYFYNSDVCWWTMVDRLAAGESLFRTDVGVVAQLSWSESCKKKRFIYAMDVFSIMQQMFPTFSVLILFSQGASGDHLHCQGPKKQGSESWWWPRSGVLTLLWFPQRQIASNGRKERRSTGAAILNAIVFERRPKFSTHLTYVTSNGGCLIPARLCSTGLKRFILTRLLCNSL